MKRGKLLFYFVEMWECGFCKKQNPYKYSANGNYTDAQRHLERRLNMDVSKYCEHCKTILAGKTLSFHKKELHEQL